jgi:hypothetical protein
LNDNPPKALGDTSHVVVWGYVIRGVRVCSWIIDMKVLGDPAPGCPKDLEVLYSNISEHPPLLRRAYVPAEASGQLLRLPHEDAMYVRGEP